MLSQTLFSVLLIAGCCCPLKSGHGFLGLTGRDELAG